MEYVKQIVCSAFLMSLGCFAILFGLYGIIYTDWSILGIIALLGGIAVIIASMALVFIYHGKCQ